MTRIDIVHMRDPDSACDHDVYLDGRKVGSVYRDGTWVDNTPDVELHFYEFDPGAGYEMDEFADNREHAINNAPDFLKDRIAEIYDNMEPTYEKWGY